MSRTFRIPQRERWAARSMVVSHWLVSPQRDTFRTGDVICELNVDGHKREVRFTRGEGEDVLYPHYHYVAEGTEVGPFGGLLEFSEHGPGLYQIDPPHGPLAHRERYPQVFLSYRRTDSEAYAGRLHESLSRTFGADEVFMDQFSIRPGEIFPWVIQQSAAQCSVMLAIIGPRWLSDENVAKLRSDDDFVRLEVTAALDRGTQVIPILVERAEVPDSNQLSLLGLSRLAERQMMELSARYWRQDVELLEAEIRRVLDRAPRRD